LKAQKSFPEIEADAKNPFFGSAYSSLAEIVKLTTPVLAANGLAVSQVFETDDKGRDCLCTLLRHTSGQWLESHLPLKVGKKDDMQALGSAISYARRYSLMAVLNIATKHDDDDGNAASQKSAATTKEIQF